MYAPHELSQLGIDPAQCYKSDNKGAWRCPCPQCGGHRRFVMFCDKPFPKWHGYCDLCGFKAWADELSPALKAKITEEQRLAWKEEREREEQLAAATRRAKLSEFTDGELWKELHDRMQDEQRSWWESQGIPREWQDYYMFGYTPRKRFQHDGAFFESPAYTMPIFAHGRQPVNMSYRLVNIPDGAGKYRQEYGLPPAVFLSNPDERLTDKCIIVEGEKKAAVLRIYLPNAPHVLGLPSCSSHAADAMVAQCGRVWIVLDPDATKAAHALAQRIGKAARIVTLPVKPDDAILQYGMTPSDWRQALKHARKV